MAELRDLFNKRDETFKTHSDEIFDSLTNVIDGCREFIAKKGGDEKLLDWEEIKLVQEESIGDLIVLVGSLSYKPGDSVTLPNGDIIEVNENTADYFKAMLHIAVPYNLATSGSSEEISEFLAETMEMTEPDAAIMVEKHRETPDNDVEHFNLDELDTEQQEKLKLSLATSKSGVKN